MVIKIGILYWFLGPVGIANAVAGISFDFKVGSKSIHYERSEKEVSLTGDGVLERYSLRPCERSTFIDLESRVRTLANNSLKNVKSAPSLDPAQVVVLNMTGGLSVTVLKAQPLGEFLVNFKGEILRAKMIAEKICKK